MDTVTLKKKLSAYLSDKGYLKNVSNEVLYEVLLAWENWPGTSRDFIDPSVSVSGKWRL
jgi:hypothetical protein